MKTKHKMIKKGIWTASLLAMAATTQAQFNYNAGNLGTTPGDLLLCFRPTLLTGENLVVDAGPVTGYLGLTAGTKITNNIASISGTNGTFLSKVGTNNVYWSALASARYNDGTRQVWVTSPRTVTPNVPGTVWPVDAPSSEGLAAGQIDSIGADAFNIATEGNNDGFTTTAVLEFAGGTTGAGSYFNSYEFQMDSSGNNLGNLGGKFWGLGSRKNVEQRTSPTFTSSTYPSRSDFYELDSTNYVSGSTIPGKFVGVFDFLPTGQVVFTAGSAPVVLYPPPVLSIVSDGGQSSTTISTVTSVNGAIYTLLSSTDPTAPVATWTKLSSQTGTGSSLTFNDAPSAVTVYYSVSVH